MSVGEVSPLGERNKKLLLFNKQENGLKPLKSTFFFTSCPIFSYKIRCNILVCSVIFVLSIQYDIDGFYEKDISEEPREATWALVCMLGRRLMFKYWKDCDYLVLCFLANISGHNHNFDIADDIGPLFKYCSLE